MKNGCFTRLAGLGPLLGGVPLVVAVGGEQAATGRERRRKAGFSWTVSMRALIILLPIAGSLAQNGTRPHRRVRS